jgi:hypothetical protein
VEILLTDDLDGNELPAGKGETVTFALDGSSYEIDLGTKDAAALRRALAVYTKAARPIRNRRRQKGRPIDRRYRCSHREGLGARQWLRGQRPRPRPE